MTQVRGNPALERDHLVAALEPLMGTLNYHAGPGARTAVGQDSVRRYERLWLALRRAKGETCPRCDDTGRWKSERDPHPCPLRHEDAHGHVPIPPDVIAFMVSRRDRDRHDDAHPDYTRGVRVGPPRYEAELAVMGLDTPENQEL